MSNNAITEVLNYLPAAEEQGLITKEEKMKIKELLMEDDNIIVTDYLEEYSQTKDKKAILNSFKKYLKDIESDDEQAVKEVIASGSPKDLAIVDAKKKRGKKVESKKDVFANLEECEDGLSPKIIFNKK